MTALRSFSGGLVALAVGAPLALSLVAKRRGLRPPSARGASPAIQPLPSPEAIVPDLWPPHAAASPHDPASSSTEDRPPFGDYQAHRWPYPSLGH